jgi:septal ring factor EnvC (AmiA/AmiB activator)
MHPLAGHTWSLPIASTTGKQFTGRACVPAPLFSREKSITEHDLLLDYPSRLVQMKRTLFALLFPVILFISSSVAQTPDSKQEQELAALIKEVQAQQAQIADNQAKIETQLADVAETVRVARIFSKREK